MELQVHKYYFCYGDIHVCIPSVTFKHAHAIAVNIGHVLKRQPAYDGYDLIIF